MKVRYWTVGVLALLFVVLPVSSQQVDKIFRSDTPEVMKGLKGVSVVVEDIEKDAQEDGLKKEEVQTDVELKLRQSGIKVLDYNELLNDSNTPYIYVVINTIKHATLPFYSVSIRLSLQEPVYLKRDRKTQVRAASTWTVGAVCTVGAFKMRSIRDFTKDLADKFCNDYLKANPKK